MTDEIKVNDLTASPEQEVPVEKQVSTLRLVATLGIAGMMAGLLLVLVNQHTKPLIDAYKAEQLKKVPASYRGYLDGLKKAIIQRKDGIRVVIMGMLEKRGDTAYRDYDFIKTKAEYEAAVGWAKTIQEVALGGGHLKRLSGKLEVTHTTGKSYLANKVKTCLDLAEFYNVKDERGSAKGEMKKALL